MDSAKRLLRRWPRLYGMVKRVYYAGLWLGERYLFGTKLHEWLWHFRRFEDWARRSVEHPHRGFLARRLESYAPVTSVLEIGCNAGPNLVVLRRTFPSAALYGIDVNRRAIEAAERLLADAGIANVSVAVGVADDLSRFPDKGIDLVISDATLMYVGPDKIERALTEMARVARKAVVLVEWNRFDDAVESSPEARSSWYFAHWIHDYRALLAKVAGVRSVEVEPLPEGLWEDSAWETFGAVVHGRV